MLIPRTSVAAALLASGLLQTAPAVPLSYATALLDAFEAGRPLLVWPATVFHDPAARLGGLEAAHPLDAPLAWPAAETAAAPPLAPAQAVPPFAAFLVDLFADPPGSGRSGPSD